MKKLAPKQVNTIFMILLLSGAAIGFVGTFSEIGWLSGIGIAALLFSIVFRVIFYRCPHCNGYLDRSTGDFCPYCGEKINE